MGVVIVMAVAGQLEDGEPEPRGDQDRAHDRVFGALDGRAELKSDGDDHTAEHYRHQHMGHPGQAGQSSHAGERVAPGPAEDGQRHPVVGQHGMPETNAGGGGQECRAVLSHA
jgi:hypothetical protein